MQVPSALSSGLDRVRPRSRRDVLRAVLVGVVVCSLLVTAVGAVTDTDPDSKYAVGERVAEPRPATTLFTTSQAGNNYLTAVSPNGTVTYFNDTYDVYNDVDPSPLGEETFLYVATNTIDRDACGSYDACHVSVVEHVNISTGETTRLFSRTTAVSQNQYHDVDRVGKHEYLVGDIAHDRVYVLNVSSGIVEWGWHAQSAYPVTGGGIFPGDWTHLNDVEKLPDGRVMTNLRNQDSVVFVDPETGIQENWTLGTDDDHATLYEQHNPDYIPESQGGPAVVVGDSENNRVIEYQREDGEWVQSWVWQDSRMQWPRDADRLPNGHTLVADSNGKRVLELDQSGEIVWQIEADGVYDVERVGTGDESTGGRSAAALGLTSSTAQTTDREDQQPYKNAVEEALLGVKRALPSPVVNGVLYVLPAWVGFVEFVAILAGVLAALAWAILEYRWSPYSVGLVRRDGDGEERTSGGD